MNTVYQGQTFRLKLRLRDRSENIIDLTGVTGEARFARSGTWTTQIVAADVDEANGTVTVTVDRTSTATWRPGETYGVQVWLDHGEGSPIEAEMIYFKEFKVERAF